MKKVWYFYLTNLIVIAKMIQKKSIVRKLVAARVLNVYLISEMLSLKDLKFVFIVGPKIGKALSKKTTQKCYL